MHIIVGKCAEQMQKKDNLRRQQIIFIVLSVA